MGLSGRVGWKSREDVSMESFDIHEHTGSKNRELEVSHAKGGVELFSGKDWT